MTADRYESVHAGRVRVSLYANPTPTIPRLPRLGLALCSGGITGALFEVGILQAFNDILGCELERRFEVFVGASAGASVVATLAQRVRVSRLFQALYDLEDSYFPFERRDLLRPSDAVSFAFKHLRLRHAVTRGVKAWAWGRGKTRLSDEILDGLSELLPRGIFRLDRYRRRYGNFLKREGLSRHFHGTARELFIVANDLDSGRRVVFGRDEPGVDIPAAVAASSAVPVLFEPVRIRGRDYFDGGIGRVGHIDVLVTQGVDRVVVINPVVPIDNDRAHPNIPRARRRLSDKGMLWIADQAYRIANKVRLRLGIEAMVGRTPGLQVLLVEPSSEEAEMFLNGTMSLTGRHAILDYARQRGKEAVARQQAALEGFFEGRSRSVAAK